jgi:5-methylcytosine-specific restriction endonuclease McrA
MPWIRLSDDYFDHPKFSNLSDGAFRLWHEGLAYCRKFQTDGLIPAAVMRRLRSYSPKRMRELMAPWMPDRKPLWDDLPDVGVKVHDYLDWNLSKEEEQQQREESKQRMALGRDPEIRRALRSRDGNNCRYCARVVSWTDRRGPGGATYDHVTPGAGDHIENLVIACRGCNSKKGRRTPAEAGMELRPPLHASFIEPEVRFKSEPRSEPKSSLDSSGYGLGSNTNSKEEMSDGLPERAGRLRQDTYPRLYAKYRHGARLALFANAVEFQDALVLVGQWTDERLEKLATLVLTTDDPWISGTDRGFKVFVKKASWADEKLAAWEAQQATA